ncbi:MAG TPA: 3-isopropylmalate dehydratase large subunit [Hyphomicrobiaceae bacterium]|nr:3-isopropylmalate dehydratase large subunit [Hyphomicrobiaceae bacterium]
MAPRTLYDKIWDSHVVHTYDDGTTILYVDQQLIHEVLSPQAFEGLRLTNRRVRRPEATLAVADHNTPTTDGRSDETAEDDAKEQLAAIRKNCRDFGITFFGVEDKRNGIVHVIGPEQGVTQPGMTLVCCDSHTATHGAFGALAFGVSTSEVEHVLATQTLLATKSKNMRIRVDGRLPFGVTSKDLILAIIGKIGTAGGTGYVVEFAGEAVRALSMESRMTMCNMAIEGGARAGLVAPDEKTFAYVKGRTFAPRGADWERAVAMWSQLPSDPDARYDREVVLNGPDIAPMVTWGTNPEQVTSIDGTVPDPEAAPNADARKAMANALAYMGLTPGTRIAEIKVDKIFIGSCTNSRIEDLREVAKVLKGRRIASHVAGIVVPGSQFIKQQAEEEGIAEIVKAAGLEWRNAGCSMCLGMNPDRVPPGERCASTSNRNFVGRQGYKARTHLVSPVMAAAAAIAGHFVDVRSWA